MGESRLHPAQSKRDRLLCLLILVPALLFIVFLTIFPVQNNDVWWQISAGREMIRSGSFLGKDVFSCTIYGEPWVNKYAAFEIPAWFAFSLAGGSGLIAFRAVLILLSIVLIIPPFFLFIKNRESVTGAVLASLTAVMTAFLMTSRMYIRPELFSLVFFSLFIFLWERKRNRKADLIFISILAVLQAVWTNMHSAYILGLLISGAYIVERFICRKGKIWKEFLILPLLAVSTFLNPYGWNMLFQIMEVTKSGSFHYVVLVEWLSPFDPRYPDALRWFIAGAVILTIAGFALNRKEIRISHVLLFLFFTIFVFKSRRHEGFFALVFGICNLWNYSFILSGITQKIGDNEQKISTAAAFSTVFVFLVLNYLVINGFLFSALGVNRPFGFGVQNSRYPVDCADFMQKQNIKGNLFNDYDSGGYLIWRLTPKVRPCIDGRAEPFPEDLVMEHWNIINGEKTPDEFLERYDITLALVEFDDVHLLEYFGENKEWVPCNVGFRACLFLKKTERNKSLIEQYGIKGKAKKIILPNMQDLARKYPYADLNKLIRRRQFMLRRLNLLDMSSSGNNTSNIFMQNEG